MNYLGDSSKKCDLLSHHLIHIHIMSYPEYEFCVGRPGNNNVPNVFYTRLTHSFSGLSLELKDHYFDSLSLYFLMTGQPSIKTIISRILPLLACFTQFIVHFSIYKMSLSSLSSLSDPEEVVHRRCIKDRINLFEQHDGEDCRNRYRIPKDVVFQVSEILDLEPETRRNKSIDGLTQLLIYLRFFATGSFQQVLGDLINVHKSTVCRIVQKVTHKLASLCSSYIKMPEGEELRRVAEGFFEIDGLPRVVGALDCTHVKIISRGGSLSELYRCRKGFFSINVQAVCDASLKIRDIIVRWPGSVHGATIFNNSHLCADFERGKYSPYYLLGDSGYFNKNYLLTPILQPQNRAEEAYNKCQLAKRNTIERCFGVLKRRCPCLEKGITLRKTSTILQVIVACVVLHNICIELDEVEPPNDLTLNIDDSSNNNDHLTSHTSQTSVRTALIKCLFIIFLLVQSYIIYSFIQIYVKHC